MKWGQFGGLKGSSILDYLIDFVNFILYNQDLTVQPAVLAVMIDFSKAFNGINHNIVISILSEMGVPGWLLKIVIGFLTDREMILRYKGSSSSRKSLPGGGPQGTLLGLFLFLILINAAGIEHLQKHLGDHITTKLSQRKPLHNTHLKYVDDMTMAEAINLKMSLMPNPDVLQPRPLAYLNRTQHILPQTEYKIHEQLNNLLRYCQEHQMVVNEDKTKVMLFNTGRDYDFMPKLSVNNTEVLEVVEEFKLLGVKIQSDLKWQENTNFICKKAYERVWMIRRLKSLGANTTEMLDVYEKQVRSILELAVPVLNANLT